MDIESIQKVQLQPGDRIVIRYSDELSIESQEHIAKTIGAWAGDIPCLVLTCGSTFEVVSGVPA